MSVDNHTLRSSLSALMSREGEKIEPFGWQMRMLGNLMNGELPGCVDLPTGLGKTSIMALWLIALAHGASLPRRLVYIVDRRAVVDQASRFAEQLRQNLSADLAMKLGFKDNDQRLPISTLRGGLTDNRDWLEDPSMPAIIVGTIDMIGSRLLFEGYGVSRRMRPYHAGLLGVDALYLLDEAHLCPPFEALLRQVERGRNGELGATESNRTQLPPFRLMSLSATGRDDAQQSGSTFQLLDEDRNEPVVWQRVFAEKRVHIDKIEDPKLLVERLTERAFVLGTGETPARILVYCDSRKNALEVNKEIDKRFGSLKNKGGLTPSHCSELLVGERRVYERKALENWLKAQGFIAGSHTQPQTPTFLVATSAGEVGVDLDADHLVCDLVAYERMVQRFGRVNRRGGEGRRATVSIIAVSPSTTTSKGSDESLTTYESRLAALQILPQGDDSSFDASPSAIAASRGNPENAKTIEAATTRTPLYPKLIRPLLDAWSMTALKQHEGRPEVAPWLRGWEEDEEPQTTVVWRKYLPQASHGDEIKLASNTASEFFRAAPIHGTEKLEAPSNRVFDWLLKRAGIAHKRTQDDKLLIRPQEIAAIVLNHAGEYESHLTLDELVRLGAPTKILSNQEKHEKERWKSKRLPGSVLIADARIGGLSDGMLDENSKVPQTPTADADENWINLMEDPSSHETRPSIGFRIEKLAKSADGEGLSRPVSAKGWRHTQSFETEFSASGDVQGGLAIFKHVEHETDEEARSIASTAQTLIDHAKQTAECAYEIAVRLGLPAAEVNAIKTAAEMHDDGKAAKRWQDAVNAPKDGRPYAKTEGGGNWRLLEGYRHEFGSLIKAEKESLPSDTRDLILHLIASHHGGARPIINSDGCEDGPPSLLESKAGDAALRFARLQKRYGPWGLAWREAILRAADQRVSRQLSKLREDQKDG